MFFLVTVLLMVPGMVGIKAYVFLSNKEYKNKINLLIDYLIMSMGVFLLVYGAIWIVHPQRTISLAFGVAMYECNFYIAGFVVKYGVMSICAALLLAFILYYIENKMTKKNHVVIIDQIGKKDKLTIFLREYNMITKEHDDSKISVDDNSKLNMIVKIQNIQFCSQNVMIIYNQIFKYLSLVNLNEEQMLQFFNENNCQIDVLKIKAGNYSEKFCMLLINQVRNKYLIIQNARVLDESLIWIEMLRKNNIKVIDKENCEVIMEVRRFGSKVCIKENN